MERWLPTGRTAAKRQAPPTYVPPTAQFEADFLVGADWLKAHGLMDADALFVKAKDPTGAQRQARFRKKRKAVVTVQRSASADTPTPAPVANSTLSLPHMPMVTPRNGGTGITVATMVAALSLAAVSGGFSVYGMTSIFTGALYPVIGMGAALELGKLSAVAWLGHRQGSASWALKASLTLLVAVLMALNAVGFSATSPRRALHPRLWAISRWPDVMPNRMLASRCRQAWQPTSTGELLRSTLPSRMLPGRAVSPRQ
jgi:hypothetical protein